MQDFRDVSSEMTGSGHSDATGHNLLEMLRTAVLTVFSGGKTNANMAEYGKVYDNFLRQSLTQKHGIQNQRTFDGLFNGLNYNELGRVLDCFSQGWAERLATDCPDEDIAIRG